MPFLNGGKKMKAFVTLTLCAAAAFAGTASIVSSFQSPCGSKVRGLDYHDGYLYLVEYANSIYCTTTTGSVVSQIPGGLMGIDRTDYGFWSCSQTFIYLLTTSGSYVRTYEAPSTAWDVTEGGNYLWCGTGALAYRLRSDNGSRLGSFRLPSSANRGLDWDAKENCLGSIDAYKIYQLTTTGIVVESFNVPGGRSPYGITRQGQYIWYSSPTTGYIYKALPCYTAVAPASLGRVKALYR
jgi:hypothetical protein